MYKDIPENMLGIIEPVAASHGLEIVDIEVQQGRGKGFLRIIVDTPEGDGKVTVDGCAAVSREVGHGIDAAGAIPGAYTLEVCSPGVDRMLGREKDFARVVGKRVEVRTRQAVEGRRKFRGELLSFEESAAQIRTEQGEVRIPFTDISKAQAFFPFDTRKVKR